MRDGGTFFARFRWTVEILRRPGQLPTLGARLRWLWWRHVRQYGCEVCHRCGRPVMPHTHSWWHAPDDLWIAMGGPEFGITCPPCFHDLARAKGLTVYFVATVEEASPPQPDGVHTIPVPLGWSAEQAWETIRRGDLLSDSEPSWVNVVVKDGKFVELCDA